MKNSAINWTDHTANFWWGCMKVSEGCKNCYAETLSKRWGKHIWGTSATTERDYKSGIWKDIRKWDDEACRDGIRRRVFVSSMSDFLEDHPQVQDWRERAKALIYDLKNLDVLMLTKRPENASIFLSDWYNNWPSHVWMGTTVENQKAADVRIPQLAYIPAKIHFLSVEPMMERIDLDLRGKNYGITHSSWEESIDWVIVGGESGHGCRPFNWDWARDIKNQCAESNIAFWMKQGGGFPYSRHELEDLPEDLRVRELPRKDEK